MNISMKKFWLSGKKTIISSMVLVVAAFSCLSSSVFSSIGNEIGLYAAKFFFQKEANLSFTEHHNLINDYQSYKNLKLECSAIQNKILFLKKEMSLYDSILANKKNSYLYEKAQHSFYENEKKAEAYERKLLEKMEGFSLLVNAFAEYNMNYEKLNNKLKKNTKFYQTKVINVVDMAVEKRKHYSVEKWNFLGTQYILENCNAWQDFYAENDRLFLEKTQSYQL